MINVKRRNLIQLLAAGATSSILAGRSFAASQKIVNTYGGRWEKFWRDQLLPEFKKRTGNDVVLDVGLTASWISNIRSAARDNPPYDVLMTNEIYADTLRTEGYLEPWDLSKIPNAADIHPKARNPSMLLGLFSPVGIAYRTDLINTRPTSWKDLWEIPEYKGKLGLYEISNMAGYMFLLLSAKIFGGSEYNLDVGFEQVRKLLPFQQSDYEGTMGIMMSRGEVAIAPMTFTTVADLRKKGMPIEIVIPVEGVFMFDQCFHLLKNATDPAFAYAYVDFMLSSEVQQSLASEFLISPVSQKIRLSDELRENIPLTADDLDKVLVWDWKAANEKRSAVMDEWNRTMR